MENVRPATIIERDATFTIPLVIDDDQDSYLSSRKAARAAADEEPFPREVIAAAVGSTNLQAELGRPLLVGTYQGLPAYLLRTKFSFQRLGSINEAFSRIQAAQITVIVEAIPDSEDDGTGAGASTQPVSSPAVAAWYPELWQGKISERMVGHQSETSLGATYLGAGLNMKLGKTTDMVEILFGVPYILENLAGQHSLRRRL